MLKQLAPIAVMPPSPKTIAWIIKTTDTAKTAAQGPRRIAIKAPPDCMAGSSAGDRDVEHHNQERKSCCHCQIRDVLGRELLLNFL